MLPKLSRGAARFVGDAFKLRVPLREIGSGSNSKRHQILQILIPTAGTGNPQHISSRRIALNN